MGELKSCLFCGKHVDEAFEYCPHCGYEFGEGDETSAFGGDKSALGGDKSTFGSELPGLIGEECGGCVPEEDEGYLRRLRTLQEILSDMERELDLLLAMEGEVGRGEARRSRAKGGS
jgi:hypothetical protein